MSAAAACPPPRVLVVEDEPLLRLFNADILSDAGFDVLEAANATEALRLLEAGHDIDVVFTDVEMPGQIDGFALAEHIEARWPEIGVLVTSGRRCPAQGFKAPTRRFLPKPFRIDDVLATIATFARARQMPATLCA